MLSEPGSESESEYTDSSIASFNYDSSEESDSEADIDFDNSACYDIVTATVQNDPEHIDTETPWTQVTVDEPGDFLFDFDPTHSGVYHVNNCEKPIDFFTCFTHHVYLI